ncbi:MAG: ThiF family adenylyltransferase [Deltaproteobacteria bacterium]|nr:ThiF family adenylyltransferase [Deltaproteobacteria bacterium]
METQTANKTANPATIGFCAATNIGILTVDEGIKLNRSKVAIVGLGGVGGIAAIQCARLGIQDMHLIDGDAFEVSNLTRQMLCSIAHIGRSKAMVAAEALKDINPKINSRVTTQYLTEENSKELLAGTDVIIDCTDNLVARIIIHRAARDLGIPSIWIAVTPPFRGGVMTFTPDSMSMEEALSQPSRGRDLTDDIKREILEIKNERARYSVTLSDSINQKSMARWAKEYIEGKVPWTVISPMANIVGILASFEAMKVLLNRPQLQPVKAPAIVRVDLSKPEMVKVETPEAGRWDNTRL